MRLYQQAGLSLVVLAAGAAAWLFFAPAGRDVLAGLNIISASDDERAGTGGSGGGFGGNVATVVTAAAGTGTVNDSLSAIGDGKARQSVTLTPEEAGTVKDILIASGDDVEAGEVLIQLDDREQVLARDQADVALQSATRQAEVNRRIKSSISDLTVYATDIAEKAAQLDLETAELNLSRRQVVAPFSGVAGIIAVNVGDYVTTSTQLMTIDDRSAIQVDFAVPERFVSAVAKGQDVEAHPIAAPNYTFSGTVLAVDNRIEAASRTFTVRAEIDNPDDVLRAGMAFQVSMKFPGQTYAAVDPLAIQWDSDGSYVWRYQSGTVEKVRIIIVQRNPDAVLVDGDVASGDEIVIEGLQRLREGMSVKNADEPAIAQAS